MGVGNDRGGRLCTTHLAFLDSPASEASEETPSVLERDVMSDDTLGSRDGRRSGVTSPSALTLSSRRSSNGAGSRLSHRLLQTDVLDSSIGRCPLSSDPIVAELHRGAPLAA